MFDTLIQYFHLTGDSTYNSLVTSGILFQIGPNNDFMPPNQTKSEGNDDQSTWALAAMSAAEANLPTQGNVSWIDLAEAVFNDQVSRWDTTTCNGGLRWQIFAFNNGYTYKNSGSNGFFFQLAARLARYTGNSTYSDWASKAYDWTTSVGLIDEDYNVYDGADTTTNCSDITKLQWSENAATYIAGAAHLYNITTGSSQTQWKTVLDGLLQRTLPFFFPDGVAVEIPCETQGTCDTDQKAFKGVMAKWLVDTLQVAPYTLKTIMPMFTATAQAAAQDCVSPSSCPFVWTGSLLSEGDGTATGVGEHLDALSFVQGLLVGQASLATQNGGGSSSASATVSSSSTVTGSGAAATASKNAGVKSGGGKGVRMAMLAGFFGPVAWLML
jgi:mannan endo-1,6-alpha-mannosidase